MSAALDLHQRYADVRKRLTSVPAKPVISAPPVRDVLDVVTKPAYTLNELPYFPCDVREIITDVLSEHRMQWRWITSQRRNRELVEVRRIIARRLSDELNLSTTKIGAYMERDHSTIVYLLHCRPRDYLRGVSREAIIEIRHGSLTVKQAVERYRLSHTMICDIRNGRRFGFVE